MENQVIENTAVVAPKPPIMIQLSVDELKTLIVESVQQVVDTLELAEDDPFISAKKAAGLLDVSTKTLENYRTLKKYRHPNKKTVRYKKSEVLAFFKNIDFFGRLIKE